MMAFLPIVLDLTILHVAVPSLSIALQATGTEVLWIIDIYPLLMASLLIPMGTLADRVGHRHMLMLGLGIFCSGSVLAAFAPSAEALIGARAFMAFGAAMVMPCTLAIVRQTFEDEGERAMALGIWGAVASAGAALGPLAGGALLEHFWWGAVFLVNVPVMLFVIPLVMAYIPVRLLSAGVTGKWPIDQALILILGIMATVYGLKSAFRTGSSLLMTIIFLAFGILMLCWFSRKQLRSPDPMLDLSLFSVPAISAGVVMSLVVMGALAGVELMLAQELQFVLGQTPLEAGIFMLPLMIGSAVGGPLAGMILQATGLRRVASLSLLVSAGSLLGLAFADLDSNGAMVILAALGLSLSVGMTASSVAIMSNTPVEKAGSAGALEATSYDLGSGLGITVFGILLTSSYERSIRLPDDLPLNIAETAGRSIGETMMAAKTVGGHQAQQLVLAGQQAFSASHSLVLLAAAALVGLVSIAVWKLLRSQ
ncbi:MFS transporter [Pseudomonas capsici]|nr:MFS transporter [Pseudomonas capsici]